MHMSKNEGRFIPREELVILTDWNITMQTIEKLERFHENFPDKMCYVEDENGRIQGLLSVRERKLSVLLGRPAWNDSFFYTSEADGESIERLRRSKPTILTIPYVKDDCLKGEFSFSAALPVTEYMQWSLLKDSLQEWISERRIRSVRCTGNDSGISGLKTALRELGIDTQTQGAADFYVLGYSDSCRRYIDWLNGGDKPFGEHETGLYDFYMDRLITQCLSGLKRHHASFWYFEGPRVERFRHLHERDRELLMSPQSPRAIASDENSLSEVCDLEEDKEYIRKLSWNKRRFIERNGYFGPADFSEPGFDISIINGKRTTCRRPDDPTRRIYCFGICMAAGWYVPNDGTVESLLQKKLIDNGINSISVENCGTAEGITGAAFNDFQHILHTTFCDGDVVCAVSDYSDTLKQIIMDNGGRCRSLSPALEERRGGRWFLDLMLHINRRGNAVISDTIYDALDQAGDLRETAAPGDAFRLFSGESGPNERQTVLKEWTDRIGAVYPELLDARDGRRTGAIVMNCNPFTYGHRYLIEEAVKTVDRLIVFVVEEDRSVFPFAERIEMVKNGTADMKNVYVVPSGKLIISSDTFPEYFEKEQLQDQTVDTTKDLSTFIETICPIFCITDRFVGEEPFDRVTESYNRTMERILGEHRIGFHEIPRKKVDGKTVSASYVRELLKRGEWEELARYVPDTTLECLRRQTAV